MKKGKISNSDKLFIEQNKNLPIEQLAKEIDRSVDAVKQILDSLPKSKGQFNKIIKENGKYKNTRVMTPEVSQILDSTRKKKSSDPSFIHRPYGDDS